MGQINTERNAQRNAGRGALAELEEVQQPRVA
jgi:hypothetical protein